MYYDFFAMYCEMECYKIFMYLIFFIIGLSLVPAGGVLCIFVYIVSGLYGGLLCAIEGYKYNVGRGIVSIWETIYRVDSFSNEVIFCNNSSCFPDCKDTCKTEKKKKPKKNKGKEEKTNNIAYKNKEECSSKNEAYTEIKVETSPEYEKESEIKVEVSPEDEKESEIKEENSPKNEESEFKEKLIS